MKQRSSGADRQGFVQRIRRGVRAEGNGVHFRREKVQVCPVSVIHQKRGAVLVNNF